MEGSQIASEYEPLPELYSDIPYLEARRHVITSQIGWFLKLEKLKPEWGVLEIAKEIGYSISVLTKGPARKHIAWDKKVGMVQQTTVRLHRWSDHHTR
jgi:hypothetical protein